MLAFGAALDALVAASAEPSPVPTVDPELVTPGPWGFAAVAFIALAVIVLVFDMQRRVRRTRYRQEVNAELDAEQQAEAAVRASDVDDEDIDPVEDGTNDPGPNDPAADDPDRRV